MVGMDEIEDCGCGREGVTGAVEEADPTLIIELGGMGHSRLAAVRRVAVHFVSFA